MSQVVWVFQRHNLTAIVCYRVARKKLTRMLDLNNWQVESLRCSVFPTDTTSESGETIWQSLVGSSPDIEQRYSQRQITTVEGAWKLARLRLDIQRAQMDWRAIVDVRKATDELLSIGTYGDVKSDFQPLMQRWLRSDCPCANRIAFGAILLLPQESMVAAFKMLDTLLPAVKVDSNNTLDFIYRINRRRNSSSSVQDLQINRISNWSVVEIVNAHVEMPGQGNSPSPMQIQSSMHLCRLELDINSVPEHSFEFDNKQMESIFEELAELGTEIAIKGDSA